jgi:hypothetical protein
MHKKPELEHSLQSDHMEGWDIDATCERCLEEDESATHILCDFVTWASFLCNQVTVMTPP